MKREAMKLGIKHRRAEGRRMELEGKHEQRLQRPLTGGLLSEHRKEPGYILQSVYKDSLSLDKDPDGN